MVLNYCAYGFTAALCIALIVPDILWVLMYNCVLDYAIKNDTTLSLGNFELFYRQYGSGGECAQPIFYQCIEGKLQSSYTNPNDFNKVSNIAIWFYVHIGLTGLWFVTSLATFTSAKLRLSWIVATSAMLLFSLAATVVLAWDIKHVLPLNKCNEGHFDNSIVSSIVLPLYFSQGGFIGWFFVLALLILEIGTTVKTTTSRRRLVRSLSDAPSEVFLNRLSKRFRDPSKPLSNRSPIMKHRMTNLGQSNNGFIGDDSADFPNKLNNLNEPDRRLSEDFIMFQQKPTVNLNGNGHRQSELPLSANALPLETSNRPNFVAKKPSLRRQTSNEMMTSFNNNFVLRPKPNSGGFSSDSDTGGQRSPSSPQWPKPPTPPIYPVSAPPPPPARRLSTPSPPPPLSHSRAPLSYRPSASQPASVLPPIPRADYSPKLNRPRVIGKPSLDNITPRTDKTPRKAIRTPSGRSYTATEYLKGYTPGQSTLQEEEDPGVVRYLTQLKR